MAPLGRPPVMLDIVEEHFEELDFLWELREGVIFAPDWNLDELAELEERAEAHLDGLRLAELWAVDVARPHLMGEHKFGATAATFVLMETGEEEFFAEVLKALVEAPPEARDGIRIGLRHSKIDAVEKRLFELARDGEPWVRAAAADVLAFHRREVPEIRDLLKSEDDAIVALAVGALGRGNRPIDLAIVTDGLRAKSPEVRRAVVEAAACSGTPGLLEVCSEAAARAVDPDPEALAFLGLLGDPRSLSLLQNALEKPELATAALRGLGSLGNVAAVPILLELMAHAELAPAAGRAFRRLTAAANIEADDAPQKKDDEPTLEAEFADLPASLSSAKARAWWEAQGSRFAPARRWQSGRDVGPLALRSQLPTLSLQVRRDVYLGARAARLSALPTVELEARARLQT